MGVVDLQYIKLGKGHPIIVLHGLYGSGTNWLSIGKELSRFGEVFLIDQRNHASSPHHPEHSYEAMKNDVIHFMDQQGLKKAILLGHSMGGKTAMWVARDHPERVSHLIVADISPLSYANTDGIRHNMDGHKKIMNTLLDLDLLQVNSLRDADKQLELSFPDKALRQFLLKNLGKTSDQAYYWKLNLTTLLSHLENLSDGIDPDTVPESGFRQFPVLFIKGEKSNYILEEDKLAIKRIFPLSQIVGLQDAGHWLHAEQPEIFVKIVRQFLLNY